MTKLFIHAGKRKVGRAARLAATAVVAVSAAGVLNSTHAIRDASASRIPPTLSAETLLSWLTDPAVAEASIHPGLRVIEQSSHDRLGANNDEATFDRATGLVGEANYLHTEPASSGKEARVLFEQQRPGCLTRMWMTGFVPHSTTASSSEGSLADFGNLQFFLDGSTTPVIDLPATELFSGSEPGFPKPLVEDARSSSGGNVSYVPICFARSLEIRATDTKVSLHWFQFDALTGPPGTPVEEYNPSTTAAAADNAGATLSQIGQPPATAPSSEISGALAPGSSLPLARSGPGQITFLHITTRPFNIATLASIKVAIATDGSRSPEVQVPLADLFGDGLEVRPIRSLAFGMDPSTDSGYFALPIPYSDGAVVSFTSADPVQLSAQAWTTDTAPGNLRLYGERDAQNTAIGEDFTVLDASGSGRLAAWVLDLVGQLGSGNPLGQSVTNNYMEGNPIVYVDGSRSPSIIGTGTEDTFDGGFYYSNGAFSLPTNGAGPLGRPSTGRSSQSQYRVFGGDGAIWSTGLHFVMQHGAGNENRTWAASTTFSYRAAHTLVPSDGIQIGDPASEAAHRLSGTFTRTQMTAYFEGKRDGNVVVPAVPVVGAIVAPPPQFSPDGVSADGIVFGTPVSFTFKVNNPSRNVVLRRLFDQSQPSLMSVLVDGQTAGTWTEPETNKYKRWREDDLEIPSSLIKGDRAPTVILAPLGSAPETMYGLAIFSRF